MVGHMDHIPLEFWSPTSNNSVDENAFDSVLSRGDGSFLFHVHNVFEDVLLSKKWSEWPFYQETHF